MSSSWVNVSIAGAGAGVAGPFTGSGLFQLVAAGIHTYPSQQAAQSAPQQALDSAQAHIMAQVLAAGPGVAQGFFGLAGNVQQAGNDIKNAPGALAASISSSILGPLFQANIWVRVGEVLLGIVLIAVGVAKLTSAVPIATKVAQTAGAVALA